jgi:hypothetical protein
MLRNKLRGSLFLIPEFGMLVKIPTPLDNLLFDCSGAQANLGF